MSRRRKFTREFKISAVQLVNHQGYSIADAAKSLGIDANSLRGWIKQMSGEAGAVPQGEGAVQAEAVAERERASADGTGYFKKSGRVLCEGADVKFSFIEEHLSADFPIDLSCAVLEVSRAGYYAWRRRPPSVRAQRRQELAVKIRQVHKENRKVYGSPRIHRSLKTAGETVCENTVADVMREHEIRAKTKKKFVPRTTDSNHANPIADNVLDRQFEAELPDQKWAVDITYIPTDEGWMYLAGVMDLCSRKIVGWAMADHMQVELASDALTMALMRRQPADGLMHHSDRGVQYASDAYQHLLKSKGMLASMSNKADCWDNAAMESFWSTLKTELVHHEQYATRDQARASIFEYIEVFYNRKRLHSSVGYQSPEAFEAGLN